MDARRGRSTDPDVEVVLLSRQLGLPVVTREAGRVGELGDLTVRLGAAHPLVHRVLVRDGRAAYLAPWRDVAELTDSVIRLGETDLARAAVDLARLPLETDELLLARDVMDTQVVDLSGHRLSRVSDVLLLRRDDGGLEVAAADVGTAAVLRRMGLGRLARHREPVAVDWQDLHLTSNRGHLVQLSTSTAGFRRLDSRGLAELLTRLSTRSATDVIRAVDAGHAAAAIHQSHPHTGRRLLRALGTEDARRLVEAAPSREAEHLEALGRHPPPLRRRRFLRTSGWRMHRPPARPGPARSDRGRAER